MISLEPVDGLDARLARLVQLYIHEWSALIPIAIGADATYRHEGLPLYRDRDDRAAFLLIDAETQSPLGFALILRDPSDCWHVEDFFVIAGARRRGVGVAAARALFAQRPGRWTFTVRPENPAALAFWRRVVPAARETLEPGDDGVTRTRLSFEA